MFPRSSSKARPRLPFPRACGGVSHAGCAFGLVDFFSPRMRGCFHKPHSQKSHRRLFPAHAGVFPAVPSGVPLSVTFPRACGGVSATNHRQANTQAFPRACGGVSDLRKAGLNPIFFSPRMRGCFSGDSPFNRWFSLFPAHAGVFPGNARKRSRLLPFPRACGGVSLQEPRVTSTACFSPRMRGCFSDARRFPHLKVLFPAHAGVFP